MTLPEIMEYVQAHALSIAAMACSSIALVLVLLSLARQRRNTPQGTTGSLTQGHGGRRVIRGTTHPRTATPSAPVRDNSAHDTGRATATKEEQEEEDDAESKEEPPPTPDHHAEEESSIKKRMAEKLQRGLSEQDALNELFQEAKQSLDLNSDFFHEVAELRFTARSLAVAASLAGEELGTIAEWLESEFTLSPDEWTTILLPLAQEGTATLKAKAMLEAVESAQNADWSSGSFGSIESPEDFMEPLLAFGLPAKDIILLLDEKTDRPFPELVNTLPEAHAPDAATFAAWANEAEIDWDTDTYDELRKAGYSLKFAAEVFRHAELEAETAAEIIEGSSDNEEEYADIITALVDAGYAPSDAIEAVWNGDDDATWPAVITAAEEAEMSFHDIIAAIRQSETDPEDLDKEIREENEMPLEDHVRILYHLLFPDGEKETASPAPAEEAKEGSEAPAA